MNIIKKFMRTALSLAMGVPNFMQCSSKFAGIVTTSVIQSVYILRGKQLFICWSLIHWRTH